MSHNEFGSYNKYMMFCNVGGSFPLVISTAGQSGNHSIAITAIDPTDRVGGRTTINYSIRGRFNANYVHGFNCRAIL